MNLRLGYTEVIIMAFWEDFRETLSMRSRDMADKAKTFTDIASLKGQIVSYENKVLRNYRDIGRAYYKAHKNDLAKEFPTQMDEIATAEQKIYELKKKISELKGTKKCASCGTDIPNDSTFCSKCGHKAEDETFFDEEDIITDIVVDETISDIIEEEEIPDIIEEEISDL